MNQQDEIKIWILKLNQQDHILILTKMTVVIMISLHRNNGIFMEKGVFFKPDL